MSSAATGAATGGVLGSFLGPLGILAGSAFGAIGGVVSSIVNNNGANARQQSQLDFENTQINRNYDAAHAAGLASPDQFTTPRAFGVKVDNYGGQSTYAM